MSEPTPLPSLDAVCPACEQGTLVADTITQTYGAAAGTPIEVAGIEVNRCLACGNASMDPAQIRANEARVRDHKQAQGYLGTP